MRIKKVSVTGLFGIFNHEIPMNLDSRITIMHGANGVGKTILLKMIDGLFSSQFSIFQTIPFDVFRVDFDNGETLQVVRNKIPKNQKHLFDEDENIYQVDITFERYSNNGKLVHEYSHKISPDKLGRLLPSIERWFPDLTRIGSTHWRRDRDGAILSIEDILLMYSDELPNVFKGNSLPPWFKELTEQVQIWFIRANRLYSYREVYRDISRSRFMLDSDVSKRIVMVTQYSEEIATLIQKKLAEYAELSQNLDRSFPIRLMNRESSIEINSEELQDKLEELDREREHLIDLGLLDRDEKAQDIPIVDESLNSVLSIYVQDTEKKLAIFNDVVRQLEIFEGIINERFQFKDFTLDKKRGFVFTSTSPDRNDIPVESLSSGEQHELVLLYQLLFKVQPNSLILIDEPELSLHVAWQRRFVDDLQQIAGFGQFDVLIATHSPQIIGDKWDWMVDLESPDETETLEHA